MQDAIFCFKNISFDDPQNGGHFSCGKPVPHLGTSTVSDSEAVIHLAHVQHLWQSKLFVIFLVLARWRIRLCSELQLARQSTHAFCDACLLEKNCYADELWQQKFLQILHHVLGTKMGVEKWTQKCCQNLTPKMGVQKWHPKGGPIS